MAVDEQYFRTSPSDPMYKCGLLPAQHPLRDGLGADGRRRRRPRSMRRASSTRRCRPSWSRSSRSWSRSRPRPTRPTRSSADPTRSSRLQAPPEDAGAGVARCTTTRARVAFAAKKDAAGAQREIDAIAAHRAARPTSSPTTDWGVPAKEIVQTARLVATGRLADAHGDLAGAAKAYEEAIAIEDALAYMEPPYWYYPVRQSLGACACARASSTTPSRRSAIRWRACATTAGRWPGWPRSTSARATATARRRRAGLCAGLVRAGGGAGPGAAVGTGRGRAPRGREQLKPGRPRLEQAP